MNSASRASVCEVHDVEVVLDRVEERVAVLGRAAGEDDARRAGGGLDVGEQRVADRDRHRAPHRHDRVDGVEEVGVVGDDPVEVVAVGGAQVAQALLEVLVRGAARAGQRLGEEADRHGVEVVQRAGRDELGPEAHDDVRLDRAQLGAQHVGAAPRPQIDEHRLDAVGGRLERGVVEVDALADEGQSQGIGHAWSVERPLGDRVAIEPDPPAPPPAVHYGLPPPRCSGPPPAPLLSPR
jgi:hypothetical protein